MTQYLEYTSSSTLRISSSSDSLHTIEWSIEESNSIALELRFFHIQYEYHKQLLPLAYEDKEESVNADSPLLLPTQ